MSKEYPRGVQETWLELQMEERKYLLFSLWPLISPTVKEKSDIIWGSSFGGLRKRGPGDELEVIGIF